MRASQFNLAGWCALVFGTYLIIQATYAILDDLVFRSMWTQEREGLVEFGAAIGGVLSIGVLIFVLISLKKLLKSRYAFVGIDVPIYVTLCSYGIFIGLGVVVLFFDSYPGAWRLPVAIALVITYVIWGFASIIMGRNLRGLYRSVPAPFKAYSYFLIASGVCAGPIFLPLILLLFVVGRVGGLYFPTLTVVAVMPMLLGPLLNGAGYMALGIVILKTLRGGPTESFQHFGN